MLLTPRFIDTPTASSGGSSTPFDEDTIVTLDGEVLTLDGNVLILN